MSTKAKAPDQSTEEFESHEARRARYELQLLRGLIGDIDSALDDLATVEDTATDPIRSGTLPGSIQGKIKAAVSNAKSVRSALRSRLSSMEERLS